MKVTKRPSGMTVTKQEQHRINTAFNQLNLKNSDMQATERWLQKFSMKERTDNIRTAPSKSGEFLLRFMPEAAIGVFQEHGDLKVRTWIQAWNKVNNAIIHFAQSTGVSLV